MRHSFLPPVTLCLICAFSPYKAYAQDTQKDFVFKERFDTAEDFGRWKIVNVEEGSTTWTYRTSTGKPMQSKCAQILKHTPNRAEDWLISPGIGLDAGNVYEISFRMSPGTFNKPESLKAYVGKGSAASDMTTLLLSLEGVVRDDNADKTYSIRFSPESSGIHHIGFLACSDPDIGRIDLDDVAVSLLSSQKSPGAVTGLSAIPGERGMLESIITFRAPAADAAGDWLEHISHITIYRDGSEIGTIDSPKPGSRQSYTDSGAAQGRNTYSVVASNSGGDGEAAECSVFVGKDIPASVGNPRASYIGNKIILTWESPAESVNGGWFDPETLDYSITLDGKESPLANLSGATRYEYAVSPDSTQKIYEFSITAASEAGTGASAAFNRLAAGKPLPFPHKESFAQGELSSPWFSDSDDNDFLWTVADPSSEGYSDPEIKDYTIFPQDNDGGDLIAECHYSGDEERSRFVSPIIHLGEAECPVLRYALLKGPNPRIKAQIRWEGGDWEDLPEAEWDDAVGPQLWQECMIPIVSGGRTTAQLSFLCSGGGRRIHIDNVRIEEAGWSRDLAVKEADVAPHRADIGETSYFTASIRNLGSTTEKGYTLTLLRNGKAVASEEGPEIRPAETATHTFEHVASYDDQYEPKSLWTIRVDGFAPDQRSDNDESAGMAWSVRGNDVPVPDGLSAEMSDAGIILRWNAASDVQEGVKGNQITVIEDFEDYEPFLKDEAGEWTIIDRDGAATWNTAYPDFAHKGEPMAFQVFNTEKGGVQTTDKLDNIFFAHSGKQYMLCVANDDMGIPNDDWLITPRLDGRAQTVRFRCSAPQIFDKPDIIRVGYSTTDTDPDSFIMLDDGEGHEVWDGWAKQYEFGIPDGAKYFAINVVKCAMFMKIDDVCYARYDGQPDPLKVEGYNLYRNGKRINGQPLPAPEYTDRDVNDGESYSYRATTVYKEGESPYSETVNVTYKRNGIGQASCNPGFRIVSDGIMINSSGRMSVFSVDGKETILKDCIPGEFIPLEPGIHIVVFNGIHKKAIIR